jgi:hypothetical protein
MELAGRVYLNMMDLCRQDFQLSVKSKNKKEQLKQEPSIVALIVDVKQIF